MRLENWWIQKGAWGDPEIDIIWGNVYGNEKFYDGTLVHTSRVVYIDMKSRVVKTKNSQYKLGLPHEDQIDRLLMTLHTKKEGNTNELA